MAVILLLLLLFKSIMDSEALPTSDTQDETGAEESETSKEEKRRKQLDALMTSGCGYGLKKLELLDIFWTTVWSGLEQAGWTKASYFIPLFSAVS
jgi:hypothetical protein